MSSSGKPCIWLVDDSEDETLLLQVAMEHSPFQTRFFLHPEAVLNALTTEKPDVLISDIRMPAVSGFELCEQIRKRGHHVLPVVFRSSSYLPEDMEQGYLSGGNAYLVKSPDYKQDVLDIARAAHFFIAV